MGIWSNNPRTSLRRATLFKKLTEETSARRNFEDKDLAYYQAVYEEFGERAKFMVAELNFATYLENLHEKLRKLQETLNEVNEALIANPKSRKKITRNVNLKMKFVPCANGLTRLKK